MRGSDGGGNDAKIFMVMAAGPLAQWPGAARIAVNFVLNYEEGGERNILDGDAQAETYLVPEVVGLPPVAARNSIVEDLFEYGSRAGFWRLLESVQ